MKSLALFETVLRNRHVLSEADVSAAALGYPKLYARAISGNGVGIHFFSQSTSLHKCDNTTVYKLNNLLNLLCHRSKLYNAKSCSLAVIA